MFLWRSIWKQFLIHCKRQTSHEKKRINCHRGFMKMRRLYGGNFVIRWSHISFVLASESSYIMLFGMPGQENESQKWPLVKASVTHTLQPLWDLFSINIHSGRREVATMLVGITDTRLIKLIGGGGWLYCRVLLRHYLINSMKFYMLRCNFYTVNSTIQPIFSHILKQGDVRCVLEPASPYRKRHIPYRYHLSQSVLPASYEKGNKSDLNADKKMTDTNKCDMVDIHWHIETKDNTNWLWKSISSVCLAVSGPHQSKKHQI